MRGSSFDACAPQDDSRHYPLQHPFLLQPGPIYALRRRHAAKKPSQPSVGRVARQSARRMAEKDITERLLTSHNDVFADIANGCFTLMGGGRPFRRVEPEDLRDTRARSAYKAFGELHEQERDVAKLWAAGGAVICLLGLENQTAIDPRTCRCASLVTRAATIVGNSRKRDCNLTRC